MWGSSASKSRGPSTQGELQKPCNLNAHQCTRTTSSLPTSMPGPTTSDLIFSEQANHNFSKTLGELKRSTLSIHNRLISILVDAQFAEHVADAYGRPLIANERCGSWYIDPTQKCGSAYFKSTDGHTGVWKFSLRRLNLHLLEVIGKNDGCIIVDSTRRGKRKLCGYVGYIPLKYRRNA